MEQQRLPGAQRALAYTEDVGAGVRAATVETQTPPAASERALEAPEATPLAVGVPDTSQPIAALTAPIRPRPAQWGWRGRLGRVLKLAPGEEELAHREAVSTIRRATWTRAVNVLVANPKGGVGKTPTAVILAGILGQVRGGYVATFEAAESAGTLARRAEGQPVRGLAEMLTSAAAITSAGNLGGYTAPQTSHADVIGSVSTRRVLTAEDVITTRQLLDRYYRVTLADTGNNPGHPAFRAALRTADAVVTPCLVSIDSVAGVEETLAEVRSGGTHSLADRVVVVLGHDGGPEDPEVAETVRDRLNSLGVTVREVPYDPAIRLGGEISLGALSETSMRAWTLAAAEVVTSLGDAPLGADLVENYASTN